MSGEVAFSACEDFRFGFSGGSGRALELQRELDMPICDMFLCA